MARKRYSVTDDDPDGDPQTSNVSLKEAFLNIVEWVRKKGCTVKLNWSKKTVSGSNGYFTPDPKPQLCMGLKDRSMKNAIVLLLHEFCHYWQWKEDFLNKIDDVGNSIYADILMGKKVSDKDRERARKLVAISEYDCEKRTAFLLARWKLTDVRTVKDHIKAANAYNRHAAWSIGAAQKPGSGEFFPGHETLADKLWPGKDEHRWFTVDQVVSPISSKHKEVFDLAMSKHSKKTKR